MGIDAADPGLSPADISPGSDPAAVLKEVEHSLRSSFAKPIEGK